MNEKILIELYILTQENEPLLDIDCRAGLDITLIDTLEIIMTNFHYIAENIAALYALKPFVKDPIIISSEDCKKTLRELNITDGFKFYIIYIGDAK